MNKLFFHLKEASKKMWFRCLLYCLLAIFAIFVSYIFGNYIPDTVRGIITKKSLEDTLRIVASSMLAVTIFSLSILVQALNAAANTATPRANKLLTENHTAQNALGTFIGAFLFSIVALIGTTSTLYNSGSIFILFIFTALIIFLVIVMLLRWIDQLSKLGRVTITIDMVEKALKQSIENRAKHPYLDAHPLVLTKDELKQYCHPILCNEIGYVQYIDVQKINAIAEKNNTKIYVLTNPGSFLDSVKTIAYSEKELSSEERISIIDAIAVNDERTFAQDPRYGFIVLCEIALRALSPGINDQGTAIDVIGTYIRSAKLWNDRKNDYLGQKKKNQNNDVRFDRVYMVGINESDLLEDMYGPVLSEAAKHTSVSIRLKKSLISIRSLPDSLFEEATDIWIKRLDSYCSHYNHAVEVSAIKETIT